MRLIGARDKTVINSSGARLEMGLTGGKGSGVKEQWSWLGTIAARLTLCNTNIIFRSSFSRFVVFPVDSDFLFVN